jgi:hypothetical protein
MHCLGPLPFCESGPVRKMTVAIAAGVAAAAYRLVASGQLTLNTGVGRRVRPLGPLSVRMAAPRETVFDVIAGPYLARTPRAMGDEIQVLERGSDMVVAAHRSAVGWGIVATTVESVRFRAPDTVSFLLLRGPVPYVSETFTLTDEDDATRLAYAGELGTDFGWAGERWGDLVARKWEATVAASLDRIRLEAERRASVQRGAGGS